jgi:hypothetical protein
MTRALLYVVMLTLAVPLSAQTRDNAASKRFTPVTSDTVVEGWQTGSMLTSLLRAGYTNKIPLGIVLEGDSLCRNSVPGSGEGIRIDLLIEQIQRQDPDYTAEIRNRILYVHPRTIKASTLNIFDLQLPGFSADPQSTQEVGITLMMWIQGVLFPGQTTMYSGGIQADAERLSAIHLSRPVSVHDVLDHVITSGQGGFWVMHEVPPDWPSNPKTIPYDLLSYSGDQRGTQLIKCPDGK